MESIGNMLSPKGGILLSPHVPAMIQAKETKVKAIRPHHTSHVRCSLPFTTQIVFFGLLENSSLQSTQLIINQTQNSIKDQGKLDKGFNFLGNIGMVI